MQARKSIRFSIAASLNAFNCAGFLPILSVWAAAMMRYALPNVRDLVA